MSDRAFMVYDIKNQLADGDRDYAGRVYEREVEISSAEILNLNGANKELVPAPGPGKVLEFISCLLAYDAGGTVYTIGTAGNIDVNYTNEAGLTVSTVIAATGFLDQAGDLLHLLDKVEATAAPVVNAALVLAVATASPTLGTGVIHAKIVYRIHETGL